ncbi:hypothetical protein QBC47DRAFT_178875 [Echria macrotheca]|uniref:NWD NACHT-NTPase N-terminal domain-containing protein n=1 Tax=Echria macrotheca TaxID=438768 RepID=A0AAJ0BFA0_9PEZI|nr:hypothetical protein QBC47DRAFT_178875 [Echria macrotheca]
MGPSKENKQPIGDAFSNPRTFARRFFGRKPKSHTSGKAAQAGERPPTVDGAVAELSSHTTVVGRVESSSIPKPASASGEAINRPEPCGTNETPLEASEEATDQRSLWDLAYDALRKEKPDVVEAYETLLADTRPYLADASSATDLEDLLSKAPTPADPQNTLPTVGIMPSRKQKMEDMIVLGQKHMEDKKIAVKVGRQEFVLQDQIQYVVAGIQLGKDWIDNAVTASPLASAAWAGVCLILPLLTNPSDVHTANAEGFAYVTNKIEYYAAMESILFGNDDDTFPAAFREHVIELYKAIIDFQAQSVLRFFRGRFRNFVRGAVKWDAWEDMLKQIKELGDSVERESMHINAALSRAALGDLVKKAVETEEDKCRQVFRRGDYAWYKDRVEERVPDTCLWFLTHESYKTWQKADSGPLLVSADPGCGKSVLAKYLVDSRFGFSLPKEAAVCYFFFKDGDQCTIELALCALIHQLLCLRPRLIRHALPRYKQDREKLASNVTALWDILETATADSEAGTVVIILDALDECRQDKDNMSRLSKYITTHFRNGLRKKLKILMTSRPYESTTGPIQSLEQIFPRIRIKGEDDSETIRKEINSVIGYRVERMNKFNNDSKLKPYLKERLMAIEHRTYLWLYLVFEYLEGPTIKSTVKGLEAAVKHLPSTVYDAYEGILNRSTQPDEARRTLLVLLAATRPLTLCEMQIAIGVTVDTTCLEDLDLEPDEAFKQRLREMCGLFITVYDGRVYFLHQTAREFLLPLTFSPRPTTAITITTNWAHKFSTRCAHEALAEACTVYLNLLPSPADWNARPGFLDYSARNWVTHFYEADVIDGSVLLSFALEVCDPDSKNFSTWFDIFRNSAREFPTVNATAVIIASYLGLEAVVRLLLDKGAAIEAADRDDMTPLSWAASQGHEDVVRLLLDKGAVIEAADHIGRTPLFQAAEEGHESVVRLLLDKGAVIEAVDDYGRTPLSWAASQGHEAVVRLLLDEGAAIEAMDRNGQTPLSLAASIGYEAVVRLLLDEGAAIEAVDCNGQTPLSRAAEEGHEAVVRLLQSKEA